MRENALRLSEKLKEKGMDSNTPIGDISKLAHRFVYGASNIVQSAQEKGKSGRKKMICSWRKIQ